MVMMLPAENKPVGTPTPEELAAYPAAQSLFYVPADDGHPIPVYRITPLAGSMPSSRACSKA